jgi:serine/threonine protein kinase
MRKYGICNVVLHSRSLRKEFEMIDRVSQQLGNYRLIRQLGEGGFAEVYLGEHVYLKTHAAIKVLQTQLASDKQEALPSPRSPSSQRDGFRTAIHK